MRRVVCNFNMCDKNIQTKCANIENETVRTCEYL